MILVFGGSGDPKGDYHIGGTQVAFEALESMRRQLAGELGPRCPNDQIGTGGGPASLPEGGEGMDEIADAIAKENMLRLAATLEDAGNVAAFVAPTVLFQTAAEGQS